MDLSYRFPPADAASVQPLADWSLLMAALGGRQAASETALVQAALAAVAASPEQPLAPGHGAFNRRMAALLAEWAQA